MGRITGRERETHTQRKIRIDEKKKGLVLALSKKRFF
jgi:hypothetical protein